MPFVQSAKALGIPRTRVLFRHVLPAAASPTISLFGFSLAGLMSGSLLIEVICGWPGLGPFILEATLSRDFYIVIASIMLGKAVLSELLLARIALRMKDLPLAERQCGSAREMLKKVDSPLLSYQAEFLMGEIERAASKSEEAYEAYCRAREAVEHVRGKLRGEELKIAFFQNKLEVYENLVDLCLRRPGGFEEAFGYIEQAKSRALMDLLMNAFEAAEKQGKAAELQKQLEELFKSQNNAARGRAGSNTQTSIPATFLRVTVERK